jgi:hypothetical protein
MPTTNPTTNRTPDTTTPRTPSAPLAASASAAQRGRAQPQFSHHRGERFRELLTWGQPEPSSRATLAPHGQRARVAPGTPDAITGRSTDGAARPHASAGADDCNARATRRDAPRANDDADRSLLTAFVPPPSVLAAPLATTPVAAPTPGSASARAEAAALAERLVRSMRMGKIGRDGHEVRLRLDVGASGDVEVRLRHLDGTLSATLVTDAPSYVDAERLAVALRHELARRGIECEDVEVATA